MKIGDQIEFENKIIKFSKVESKKGSNYNSIVANFTIEDKNKSVLKKLGPSPSNNLTHQR